jgi:hypothetical protein
MTHSVDRTNYYHTITVTEIEYGLHNYLTT